MSNPAMRQSLLRFVVLACGAAGSLFPLGCANRPAAVFRRIWGFEQHASSEHMGGLLPKVVGLNNSDAEGSVDPFLNQEFGAPATEMASSTESSEAEPNATSTAALTLFDQPPLRSEPTKTGTSAGDEGNPFRLVQHQTPVNEISSADSALKELESQKTAGGSGQPAASGSEPLDRLKVALKQDAKIQLPPKPHREGPEVVRQRVEAIMKNARRQMQLGEYASALRWAMAAEQLAQRSELFFGPEEDPPADLVRILQDRLKVAPQLNAPIASAMTERAVPMPSEEASEETLANAQAPELTIEFPAEGTAEQAISPIQEMPQELAAVPHLTRAMQEAVIAPETLSQDPESDSANPPLTISPGQTHSRSLKVDAQRVSANQGAMVSVEGQLNPPAESALPKLELAPPAAEKGAEVPPLEVAMIDVAPQNTTPPPPLPPPSMVPEPQPAAPPFLYSDEPAPAPKVVKNVEWDKLEDDSNRHQSAWWIFPAIGMAGVLLAGWLFFKRARS